MNTMTLVIPIAGFLSSLELSYGGKSLDHDTVLLAVYLFMNDTYGLENNDLNSRLGNLSLFEETVILGMSKSPEMEDCLGGLSFNNHYYIERILLSTQILKIDIRG